MTGPPALTGYKTAPPIKRADPDGIPVRLHDGTLIAHVNEELADRITVAGDGEACRSGPRRYLRLRPGISIPHTDSGWDIVEFLRKWHGDKRAAAYIAHMDRRSEKLLHRSPERSGGRRL
jgi:hypothetical protein